MQIQMIDPVQLKPHPKNAKIHTDKQIDRIVKSMENTGGSVVPIVVDEDFTILSGHGRWMAHKKRGDVRCPVVITSGLSDSQKLKFLLADNQINAMTGNENDAVAAILQELDAAQIDISDIGFSEKELDKFLSYEEEEDERDELGEASDQSYSAHELKESLLFEMSEYVGDYQLPRLREDMLAEVGDEEFVVWMNRHRTPPLGAGQMHYHLFGRESTKGLDPTNTLISFYIDDTRFERVWSKLKENTQRFINSGVHALVMPDFTTVTGYPLPLNLWALYRSFYCARYWQEAGLYIVPNLMGWDETSTEAMAAAIPDNPPVVSVQLQTLDTGRAGRSSGARGGSPDFFRELVGLQLEMVRPKSLIVYGGERGLVLGKELCDRHGVRFVGVQNRADAAMSSLRDDDAFAQ